MGVAGNARGGLGIANGTGTAGDAYRVIVHVEEKALRREGGEADLPLPTARRLCCDGVVVPIVHDANGDVLNVGRKQRTVPTMLKRALHARDRGCTFPDFPDCGPSFESKRSRLNAIVRTQATVLLDNAPTS